MRGRVAAGLALCLGIASSSSAQWPYLTEEASVVGEGRYSVTLGASRTWQDTPFLPGGRGVLWRLPEVEGTLGVGPQAEVSFQYEFLRFEPAGDGAAHDGSGDLRLWTKLVLFPSRFQDLGLRFGVKLPNAPDEHGLGTDMTDFLASLLWDLRLGPARVSLNGGVGILGSPEEGQGQDDVWTWGTALRLPASERLELGFDAAGQSGPYGKDRKRSFATMSVVGTWRAGPWRLDLAGRRGARDARAWGWAAGITYER